MSKISGEFDDDGEYEADYDSNDVDSENDPEISNDNDQDYDPDNITESGEGYDPFECPDYDNPDLEYNPFKCPDYDNSDSEYNPLKSPDFDNKGGGDSSPLNTERNEMDQIPRSFEKSVDEDEEELEVDCGGGDAGVGQENSEKKDLEEIHESLIGEEENIDEPIEENSETEINQEAGNRAELDSKTPDHDSEMNSNVEIENINREQSTITIQQESLEQDKEHEVETQEEGQESIERDPERHPIYDSEEFEISADYEEIKNEIQEEAREGISEQEEENSQEQNQEQEEYVSQKSFERDKDGKIILDAEQIELFGGRVSSKEEMEVEILEEELEELFDSYEEQGVEQGIEQEQGLDTSQKVGQEDGQEQQELEQGIKEFYIQIQEEKVEQELEQAQKEELSQEILQKSQEKKSQKPPILDGKKAQVITNPEELANYNPNVLVNRLRSNPNQKQKSKMKSKTQTKTKQNPIKTKAKKMELLKRYEEEEKEQKSSHEISTEIKEKMEQESAQESQQEIKINHKTLQEQEEEQNIQKSEDNNKHIKERYKQETRGRPIYAGKETRGFIEWKKKLEEQENEQEEKSKKSQDKKEERKEISKENHEFEEEWAQYLAKTIKEAENMEIPKETKEELIELLTKYYEFRELFRKLQDREIKEEEFEKEVKELEYILIRKRHIARPLFRNFDWFRRYYNGLIRKAGKRVAFLYISKKTRAFLSFISRRIEQIKNIGNSQESTEKFKEFLEKSFEIKEKWALLLNNLIHETPNKEISKEVKEELETIIKIYCEIRVILFNKNILEEDKEKLIQERIEKCNPRFFELFEILKRFLGIYDNYSRNWMEQSLIFEGKKTVRRLSQKIGNIKKENQDKQALINIEGIELRGYNYLRNKIQQEHGNKAIFIKLLRYSKFVFENFITNNNLIIKTNFQQNSERQLTFENDGNLRYGDYLVKGDYMFNKILNSRPEYGYKAIVYKLKSELLTFKNKIYFGFSKLNIKKRTGKHIMAAIGPHGYDPECEYVNLVKLHKAIINALEFEGIDTNKEYQWLKSKVGTLKYEKRMNFLIEILKKHFEIETVEIHKEKYTARQNEKLYTKNYINDDGTIGTVENGLNEILGGSDGQYIDLPLIDITAMISLGVKPKEIHKLIRKLYLIDVAYETVSERIRDIWESYSESLELFLKPVVASLIKDDHDFKFYEICDAVNRDRSILREYLKDWYRGRTFPILKRIKNQGILDWSDLPFYVEEERPELRGVPLETWKNWAIEGVSCREIGEQLGLNEETIRQTYKNIPELGDKQKCCERLRREIARELLSEDWDPREIMIELFKMKPKDNYGVRTFFERLFDGMTLEDIVDKGRKGVL